MTVSRLESYKILVFIIAYNEEKSILNVIDDIRLNAPYADILLVDDCSTDNTVRLAQQADVKVIRHLINSRTAGYTAVKTAMTYAHMSNYDICCQFDGDGQHLAEYLFKIISPILDGRADLVIGSRFLGDAGYKPSIARALGIGIFSYITSLILRQRIYDVSSGFKANNKKVIKIYATYPHMITDTNEMLILAKMRGAIISEVAVKMKSRESGKSWHSFSRFAVYPFKTFVCILAVILRERNL